MEVLKKEIGNKTPPRNFFLQIFGSGISKLPVGGRVAQLDTQEGNKEGERP